MHLVILFVPSWQHPVPVPVPVPLVVVAGMRLGQRWRRQLKWPTVDNNVLSRVSRVCKSSLPLPHCDSHSPYCLTYSSLSFSVSFFSLSLLSLSLSVCLCCRSVCLLGWSILSGLFQLLARTKDTCVYMCWIPKLSICPQWVWVCAHNGDIGTFAWQILQRIV